MAETPVVNVTLCDGSAGGVGTMTAAGLTLTFFLGLLIGGGGSGDFLSGVFLTRAIGWSF